MTVKEGLLTALTSRCEHMEDEIQNRAPPQQQQLFEQSVEECDDQSLKHHPLESRESVGGGKIIHRQHLVKTTSNVISDRGRITSKLGTRESLLTAKILEAIPDPAKTQSQLIAERFLHVFQNPIDCIAYLQSPEFAADLVEVCEAVGEVLEDEPRCVFMQSPVYVFGDIHGNLEDLHFFSDNLWKMGMDLTAGKFLFLGDYVDRGMSCLECVAYLFGLKLLYPRKIFLLRGNHETRDVTTIA